MVYGELATNAPFDFSSDADKVTAFRKWLDRTNVKYILTEDKNQAWFGKYINQAYKQGFSRSGGKVFRFSKLQLLLTRTYEDLKGFTDLMATRTARIMADGLAAGKTPNQIARELSDALNIDIVRARTIARTELVHAHAEGQLDALEEQDVSRVTADVEWVTAAGAGASESEMESAGVCPKCRALSGVVFTIKQARGLIPRHPNCRCAWMPVTEVTPEMKTTKTEIERAIKKSVSRGRGKEPEKTWRGSKLKLKTRSTKRRR